MTTKELSATARDLFREGPLRLRLMQRYRPYICPFELLIPYVSEDTSVLDIGCGGGLFLALLAAQGKRIRGVGVDSSKPAIHAAEQMATFVNAGPLGSHLQFNLTAPNDPLPKELFDVVVIIDVMHHIPPADQHGFFQDAMSRVAPGGTLIYKDVVSTPLWRRALNRFHDLVMVQQWIHEVPIATVVSWAGTAGMVSIHSGSTTRFWYGHEFAVFQKTTLA
jgi:2-polyprenyl-3-methyl-5-hydroxy-6-metoxy-1,4-benzoquinol methylase